MTKGVDAHYTPVTLGVAVLEAFKPYIGHIETAWEPCAGGDALVEAMQIVFPGVAVTGTDPEPSGSRQLCAERIDIDCRMWQPPRAGLCITNPPFSAGTDAQYELVSTVCWAIIDWANTHKVPLIMIIPASWFLGSARWSWIRHGSRACNTKAAILRRPWSSIREVAAYGWNIEGAPPCLPDIEWEKDPAHTDTTGNTGGRPPPDPKQSTLF